MADLTSTDSHKNDFTGVFIKKGNLIDLVSFSIQRCDGTIVSNQGVNGVFPNDSLTVGYIYDWNLILNSHGVGKYNILVDFTIAGLTGNYIMGSYELKKYTRENAKDSVRIYSEFNSYYQKESIDFTGSNFKDTVRFNGFFGNREPETEINNLIDKGRKVLKVTRENLNKYTLITDPINVCMSTQLLDKHFLNEDIMKITDYNRFNHDFNIYDKEVVLIDTPTVEYIDNDRKAKITVLFGDRTLQDKSYYR